VDIYLALIAVVIAILSLCVCVLGLVIELYARDKK
jgi:hypothetical protein